jgi:CheY-like chemotaxis protein
MREPILPDPEFVQEVRNALAHLFDHAYLQNHPLAYRLAIGQTFDAAPRAQHLRRTLLDCIESLRPQTQTRPDDARAYAVLAYRCVDGLAMPEIEEKLALSRRQAYREYARGVEAVAGQLWDLQHQTMDEHPPSLPAPLQRLAVAQAEVERLRKDVRAEPLMLGDILDDVQRLLAPRLQRIGVRIQTVGLENFSPVLADHTMLRQALLNLFSHAADTVPGVEAFCVTVMPVAGNVQITIKASAHAPASPRLQPGAKREGVGLAVAQNLVEAQGGRIALASPPAPWQANLILPTAGNSHILVVDDNENLVALFQRYLGGRRIHVLSATTGAEAIATAVKHLPQAILIDVMMPHQDGWDVLQVLQGNSITKAIPVIICSVLHEPELALALGASDYLTKPVSQTALLAVLQRWVGTLSPAG